MMPIVNFFRSSFAIGPPIDTDAFPPTCMQPYCAPRPKGAISIAPSVGSLPSLEFRLILRLLILALMGCPPGSGECLIVGASINRARKRGRADGGQGIDG